MHKRRIKSYEIMLPIIKDATDYVRIPNLLRRLVAVKKQGRLDIRKPIAVSQ